MFRARKVLTLTVCLVAGLMAGRESSVHAADAEQGPKASQYPDVVEEGSSASSVRKAAIAGLPLNQLTEPQSKRVNQILNNISYFRRLPTLCFTVEPEVYRFFTAYPDVAVSVWRAMGISKVQMWQTGKNEYEADAGDGSTGVLEVLYRSEQMNLVVCDGIYKSPILKRSIQAKSLVLLQTQFVQEKDGRIRVTHRADLFVSFPSQTMDAVARILSPLTTSLTDSTFTEISLFLKMMSVAMVRRPDWVESVIEKMDGVPELRRGQILKLTAQVYSTAQLREIAKMNKLAQAQEEKNNPGSSTGQRPAATIEQRPATASRQTGQRN